MKNKTTIDVALLQLGSSHNLNENFLKAEKALMRAKALGADIALFPELWTTGYEAIPLMKKTVRAGEQNLFG